MKTIRLHGELGRLFGREYVLDVRTPAEAIRALSSQVKGFRTYLHRHAKDYYKVFVGSSARSTDEMVDPCSSKEVIRIVPVIQGAGGLGKIIMGVALIGFSVATGGFGMGLSAAWAAGGTTFLGALAGNIGISLLLGGVAGMLADTPDKPAGNQGGPVDNGKSYNFDGPVNTTKQGNPVPVCYGGPMRVGSQVISAGLTTVNA